ncbi:hypothetical protein BDW74DRAFT_174374 [Aspergillus multicolor]|uniref:uncharacterized protein n=1 Tax=Aspergillus multicolor TaxID=41759 RepID=UPI003CCDD743
MSAVTPATGALLVKTLTSPAALGFVPIAAHFHLFKILADNQKPATAEDVLQAYEATYGDKDVDGRPVPSTILIQDTLYAMSGLGLVDLAGEDLYSANALTRHLAESPSAVHGAVHFTTEALLAGAFLMPKLKATNFAYSFQECQTPMQYAYEMMGKADFKTFMVGKSFKPRNTPDRLQALSYDLSTVVAEAGPSTSTKMVDIGGGRGEMLLGISEAFPQFSAADLIVQEFNNDLGGDITGVTLMSWNYKGGNSPQPVQGALVYHLAHILHNLSDLEAVRRSWRAWGLRLRRILNWEKESWSLRWLTALIRCKLDIHIAVYLSSLVVYLVYQVTTTDAHCTF